MVIEMLEKVPRLKRKRKRIVKRTKTREELMNLKIQGKAFKDGNSILVL